MKLTIDKIESILDDFEPERSFHVGIKVLMGYATIRIWKVQQTGGRSQRSYNEPARTIQYMQIADTEALQNAHFLIHKNKTSS